MKYEYQEYPKALYRGEERKEAGSAAEESALRANGFACFYEAQEAPQAAAVPVAAEPAKRGPGRPRRAE